MDKLEDETFLVSSDTESEYGDENRLFYDEQSHARQEVKYTLRAFDSDDAGLDDAYQRTFVPKLNDRSHNFMKWLIETDLLSSTVMCPNAENDPDCSIPMEFVFAVGLYDLYQLKCKNCLRKESIRKNSIFYGLKCNLRSVIRLLYGWVRGIDLDIMGNMLGLDRDIVGTVYNRAAKVALSYMALCPGFGKFGGEDVVVLIDIYPYFLQDSDIIRRDKCRPILCVSEIESIPQRYWLEPLEFWDANDENQVNRVKKKVLEVITSLVKPKSIVVLPNYNSLPLYEELRKMDAIYPVVKFMGDLKGYSTEETSFSAILETIWKKPLSLCEEAQFFNPDYINQFLVRNFWVESSECDSFTMLIVYIVYETRRQHIEQYF